jgi:hypothetical protein
MPATSTCLQIEEFINFRGRYRNGTTVYLPRKHRSLIVLSKYSPKFKLTCDINNDSVYCIDLEIYCNTPL